jgi:hypothetical protein
MNLQCSENLNSVGEEAFYWNAVFIFWFLAWRFIYNKASFLISGVLAS